MKSKILIPSLTGLCIVTAGVFIGCSKNSNPQPPKTDTVIKTITDTVYTIKTDTTVNLTKGLLVYLPFSGNISDSSGNNNPTMAIGSPLTYDAHGYANNAFTGNGNEVIVTNNGSIKFDTAWSLSYAFMVNAVSSASRQVFISFVDPTTGYGPTFNTGMSVPGKTNFDVGTGDTSAHCDNWGLSDPNNNTDTTNWIPMAGIWYNAVVIYHRGLLQIYIDGALIGSKQGTGHQALLCPESEFVVGGWWKNDPSYMNGKLDNIRLYNRVLTPHEIAALASNYQVTSNSIKATPKTAH